MNGLMFILKLSRTDVIAWEAFRTGKMELALYEEDGVLFFLYQIDGIFKEGWGDAPLGLALLKPEEWPTEEILQDKTLHLYLVDSNLQVLLSLRQVQLNEQFHSIIKDYIGKQKENHISPKEYTEKVHRMAAPELCCHAGKSSGSPEDRDDPGPLIPASPCRGGYIFHIFFI